MEDWDFLLVNLHDRAVGPAATGAIWMTAPPAFPPLVEGIADPNAALLILNALVGRVCETASEWLRLLFREGALGLSQCWSLV